MKIANEIERYDITNKLVSENFVTVAKTIFTLLPSAIAKPSTATFTSLLKSTSTTLPLLSTPSIRTSSIAPISFPNISNTLSFPPAKNITLNNNNNNSSSSNNSVDNWFLQSIFNLNIENVLNINSNSNSITKSTLMNITNNTIKNNNVNISSNNNNISGSYIFSGIFNNVINASTGDNEFDEMEFSPCDPANVAFNCTIDEFLLYARGPQTLPIETALLVTILFVGIFVTGVVGNVIVCVVIVRHSAMHTATNYYLFSLAVSDLMFLFFGLPYEISIYWHQYPYNLGLPFCKIRALISEASTYVSVLTIVAFSMERFLAICHPLHLYTMSGFKRALRIIAALWIISFLSAVPFAVFTKIDFLKYPADNSTIYKSAFCAMLENPPGFPLWELSSCLFFVIPMVLIIVLYGRMGCRIKSRTRHSVALGVQQGSMHKESRHQQSRKAIIRMLAAVVITFFVCWAPFHAQRLTYLYARDWAHFQDMNTWLFSVAGWFYYVSCTINPILYNVMSHRYRVAFKETLCGRKKGYYQSNGFARDQSSFRETTIASAGGYENSHLIRVRSVRSSIYRDPMKSNALWRTKSNCSKQTIKEEETTSAPLTNIPGSGKNGYNVMEGRNEDSSVCNNDNGSTSGANIVVVVDSSINGKAKVFTENNAQENALKKDETYI